MFLNVDDDYLINQRLMATSLHGVLHYLNSKLYEFNFVWSVSVTNYKIKLVMKIMRKNYGNRIC